MTYSGCTSLQLSVCGYTLDMTLGATVHFWDTFWFLMFILERWRTQTKTTL
ncbi:hypothetical protein BDA96_01G309600 [Sorghum bicolor]|uniref:Uncharacterized protein n=2 Tax=Sorghum bicolor TaxID=4558 RepID=A0A921S3Y9_SORBI|nr:hypothetical protein BDA96_01G309600 [Sorghum bicolor]KXG38830.1 hypothetical protein SORBI_3001G285600 [Sorghum bicolor]